MFMIRNKVDTARLIGVVTVALMIAACSDSGTEPRADVGDVGFLKSQKSTLDIPAALGSSGELGIYLSNVGRRTVHITRLTTDNAAFSVVVAPDSLIPGEDTEVYVSFTNSSGPTTGTLTIVSDSFGDDVIITLNGVDPDGGGAVVTYTSDILPIFEASCIKSGCHASAFPPAGLYLGDYNLVIQRVVSGDPSASLLYTKLQPTGNMPADGGPLSDTNRELIRQWILDGAQE
jgi:hypothetical protein